LERGTKSESKVLGEDNMKKLLYPTWYEFKKDLQKEVGHGILNEDWLRIKPQEPLPWKGSFVQSTLLKLSQYSK
jgi:hypothetical protein